MSWKDIVKADYIKTKDRASVEDMFLDRVMQNDLPHVLRVYYEENKKAFHADIKGDIENLLKTLEAFEGRMNAWLQANDDSYR